MKHFKSLSNRSAEFHAKKKNDLSIIVKIAETFEHNFEKQKQNKNSHKCE